MSSRLDGIFDPPLVTALARHKIFLVHEFYTSDTDRLSKFTGLHPKVILKLKRQLANKCLPQPVNAYECYVRRLKECQIIKTLIPGLDEILDGGLQVGTLLELCGTSGSGKTQVCLNIAINIAAVHNIRAVYLDTKKDIVPSHFSLLIDALGYLEQKEDILNRVLVARPDNMYCLISTLDSLKQQLKSDKRIKVLIIDSIIDLYYPFLNDPSNEGPSLLSHIASSLHFMSATFKLSILLINLATKRTVLIDDHTNVGQDAAIDDSLIPALGKVWTGVPQTRLLLTRKDTTPVRTLSVHRSLLLPKGRSTKVYILEDGAVK